MSFLDRYEVIKSLGAGGCGEVFLVIDKHSPARRKKVIKKLRKDIASKNIESYEIIKERFEAEAKILETLESLDNKQIPKFYERFSQDGDDYLVEEWIDGKTLSQIIKEERRISEEAVKKIVTNLLPVIIELHDKGYIHRDIKTPNIILRKTDNLPVLIDFGTVKEMESTAIDEFGTSNTETILVRSKGYTPREQLLTQPVPNSDLFALARTAIYCLAGKQPDYYFYSSDIWERELQHIDYAFAAILKKANEEDYTLRFPTARKMLDAINALDCYKQGIEYRKNKEYKLAIQEFSKTIKLNPEVIEAYFYRGESLLDLNEYDSAISDFNHAIDNELSKNDLVTAHFLRGYAFNKKKSFDLSIEDYTRVIQINPEYIQAFFNRAIAYIEIKELDLAIHDLNHVINNNDNNKQYSVSDKSLSSGFLDLGKELEKKEEYDASFQYFSKAIELDPQNTSAYFNRGLVYYKKKEYKSAIKDYTTLIELNPKNPNYYYNRLAFYEEMGDINKAVSDARKFLTFPNLETSQYERVELFLQKHEKPETKKQNFLGMFFEALAVLISILSILFAVLFTAVPIVAAFENSGFGATGLLLTVIPLILYMYGLKLYVEVSIRRWHIVIPALFLFIGTFVGLAFMFSVLGISNTSNTAPAFDIKTGLLAFVVTTILGMIGLLLAFRFTLPNKNIQS